MRYGDCMLNAESMGFPKCVQRNLIIVASMNKADLYGCQHSDKIGFGEWAHQLDHPCDNADLIRPTRKSYKG